MRRRGWVIAGVHGALVFGLVWTAACFGTSGDREPEAAVADGGVIEDSAAPAVDGPVPDGGTKKPHQKRNSLAVSGRGQHSLHNFTMNDKEGREVVRLKKASGTTQISALQHGTFRVTNAKIEGVELTLYRDDTGKLSLVNALKQQPPTVRHGLMVPPTPKPKKGEWLMEIGPIEVKDATLTIGFTKKPVVFHVDSAKITVRRGPKDAGPVIYIQEVQGHMMKPKPLPKPVRIAWANGLVNLVGKPLVHLAARTCIRKSELRVDAIVEARKEPVHLEGDSAGIGGALGRLGINIAAHVKKDKMSYQHEAVHIDGGPGCKDAQVPLSTKSPKPKPKSDAPPKAAKQAPKK
jgi:hypothetical protein